MTASGVAFFIACELMVVYDRFRESEGSITPNEKDCRGVSLIRTKFMP